MQALQYNYSNTEGLPRTVNRSYSLAWYIKNNAWVTVNNDFFGYEWGDLPMIFTSDDITSENHWQITSLVTKKIVIHGNECII